MKKHDLEDGGFGWEKNDLYRKWLSKYFAIKGFWFWGVSALGFKVVRSYEGRDSLAGIVNKNLEGQSRGEFIFN